jgi:hypothetical protein
MNALDSITQIAYTLMIALNIHMAQDLGRKPVDNQQLFCMAQNIYFESRAEGEQGKQAVAHVVQNRIKDPQVPQNTLCSDTGWTSLRKLEDKRCGGCGTEG